MTRYLIAVDYTPEGMQGVLEKGGTARREMVEKMLGELGATVESFDFAFGANDAFLLVDAPDPVTVAAVTMRVGAAGAASCRTTVLLSPEEIDRAGAVEVDYRPPGS